MTRRPVDTHGTGTPDVPLRSRGEMPGREALLLGILGIGLLLLGMQLWLLTVALEMFLGGEGKQIWGLAVVSGLVFVGGLVATWLIRRTPRNFRGG